MTVYDLIAYLREMPPEAPVFYTDDGRWFKGGLPAVTYVHEEPEGGEWHECNATDPGAFLVVQLNESTEDADD